MPTPTAFLSYSWDSPAHRDWVRDLAARLRRDGIETILDWWHTAPGDQLPKFMETAVRENDFIVVICTPKYKMRSDSREGGAGYEGDIMTGEIISGTNRRKFIPVLRLGDWSESTPSWLGDCYTLDLRGEPYSDAHYQDLLDTLHGRREQPPLVGPPPPIGSTPPTSGRGPGVSTAQAGHQVVQNLGPVGQQFNFVGPVNMFLRGAHVEGNGVQSSLSASPRDASTHGSTVAPAVAAPATPSPEGDLIAIGPEVIATGRVVRTQGKQWIVELREPFIEGDIRRLDRFTETLEEQPRWDRYLLVEERDAGRLITSHPACERRDRCVTVTLSVEAREEAIPVSKFKEHLRRNPATGDFEVDWTFNNPVEGIKAVPAILHMILCTPYGTWVGMAEWGSRAPEYYRRFGVTKLTESLVKLDLIRLSTIPLRNPSGDDQQPDLIRLAFIRRVLSVRLKAETATTEGFEVELDLELFGVEKPWNGLVPVRIWHAAFGPRPTPPSAQELFFGLTMPSQHSGPSAEAAPPARPTPERLTVQAPAERPASVATTSASATPVPLVELELYEADLRSSSDHHIITTEPFLHYLTLMIKINIIPADGMTLTMMGKRCSTTAFRPGQRPHIDPDAAEDGTASPLLWFGEMQLNVGDRPISDLLVDRPMEIAFGGGLHLQGIHLRDGPLHVEFTFRDATERYGVVIPIMMEHVEPKRWHAFSDPTKYRLRRLERSDRKGGNVMLSGTDIGGGSGVHGPGASVAIEGGSGQPGGDVHVIGGSITGGVGGVGPGGSVTIKGGDGK